MVLALAPLLVLPALVARGDEAAVKGTAGAVQKFQFKKAPEGALHLHVHFPKDWKEGDKRPALVLFFGGGWARGDVKQFEKQAEYLAGRGMVVARAEYRIKSKHKTTPDKCVEDCKSAVRWLRKNAGKLGIDPKKIAAGGGSAGGHTAAATATLPGFEAEGEDRSVSSRPDLLVLFNPVMNTEGLPVLGPKKDARKLSPNHHLSKGAPPAILFFGSEDALLRTGKEYVVLAKKLGLTAELWVAEGEKHGFFNRPPWRERTLYLADRFLARHGYTRGEPTIKPPGGVGLKRIDRSPEE
jgi:acetyl esterase/lipase